MSRPYSHDIEGDDEHFAGSTTLEASDPEDWKEIVRLGIVWQMGEPEYQKAIDDLVTGRLPMNDNIPADILAVIEEAKAQ